MTSEFFPSDLENLLFDFPEKSVQQRMVDDIQVLIRTGMVTEKAVDWVFSCKQSYIKNPEFTLLPVEFPFSG